MTHLPAQRKLLLIIELSNISLHHVFIKNASIFTLDSVFNYVKKIKKKPGVPPSIAVCKENSCHDRKITI